MFSPHYMVLKRTLIETFAVLQLNKQKKKPWVARKYKLLHTLRQIKSIISLSVESVSKLAWEDHSQMTETVVPLMINNRYWTCCRNAPPIFFCVTTSFITFLVTNFCQNINFLDHVTRNLYWKSSSLFFTHTS